MFPFRFELVNELIKQSSVSKDNSSVKNQSEMSPEINSPDSKRASAGQAPSTSGKTIQKLVDFAEPENYDIVQLRGSTNPKWLKHPFIALPQQNSTFEKTPVNKMLQKMWREMSPFLE